jgi:Flp pilus assembly protein TadB
MLEEVIDLTTGLGVMLLPLLVLAVPSVVLFVLLPALVLLALAAPFLVIGALIAAPYLLVRWLRRRRAAARPDELARVGRSVSVS